MNATAGIFRVKTDKQLIKEHSLATNSQSGIDEVLNNLNSLISDSKSECPKDYESMCEWGKSFSSSWNLTKALNPVSPLMYLINYSIQTNTSGYELMTQVAFMPYEFQYTFAKHFIRRK
jgi:hypothetical protein